MLHGTYSTIASLLVPIQSFNFTTRHWAYLLCLRGFMNPNLKPKYSRSEKRSRPLKIFKNSSNARRTTGSPFSVLGFWMEAKWAVGLGCGFEDASSRFLANSSRVAHWQRWWEAYCEHQYLVRCRTEKVYTVHIQYMGMLRDGGDWYLFIYYYSESCSESGPKYMMKGGSTSVPIRDPGGLCYGITAVRHYGITGRANPYHMIMYSNVPLRRMEGLQKEKMIGQRWVDGIGSLYRVPLPYYLIRTVQSTSTKYKHKCWQDYSTTM